MTKLKLTLPKGSLEKATYELFQRASYKISGQDRTYRPYISDPDIELRILRPQEIPVYVADGIQDVGITGIDWIKETGAKVRRLLNLEYGRVKIVAAIPETMAYGSVNELLEDFWKRGRSVRISTEYLNLAANFVKSRPAYLKRFGKKEPLTISPWWRRGENAKATIYLSFGATEAKPPEIADVILDVTETGSTLSQNNLKQVETIQESSAYLITNEKAFRDPWKREKIFDLMAMLKGAAEGQKLLHIFVNVRAKNLTRLMNELPALKRPTISELSEKGWYAVNTVIGKGELLKILPTLRRLAQGLVVHEPRQVLSLDEIMEENGEK